MWLDLFPSSSHAAVPASLLVRDVAGMVLSTHGDRSHAMLVQSLAGGGGRGGTASAKDLGVIAVAIGGAGGAAGQAGAVQVDNMGVINTIGENSMGVIAQSLGGGGGAGGVLLTSSRRYFANSPCPEIRGQDQERVSAGSTPGHVNSNRDPPCVVDRQLA